MNEEVYTIKARGEYLLSYTDKSQFRVRHKAQDDWRYAWSTLRNEFGFRVVPITITEGHSKEDDSDG